ncbi:4-hydroxy-tetrahydrodipicolinate reductase [Hellea balneolensis]|uniref:4-hydroxy-tetrahydrodipicolinate reductase n=1 Tax=Hellea balneolensis TaxID=287478 RepID=UPI0004069E94|nr:4-hydroxy-tetrahydrodipicolinate reductase [Hellea balneolensis]
MTDILNIGVLGADGRMGGAIIRSLEAQPKAQLVCAITAKDSPNLGQDAAEAAGLKACGVMLTADVNKALEQCDVLIDFSSPKAAIDAALAMHDTRCHTFVTGTTGYTETEEKALLAAGDSITLLKSGNFSLGVNMLEALVELAANKLRSGWDIEILEMHHKHKVDAPSGTALMLGEAAAKGRGVSLKTHQVLSREGRGDARNEGQIGFAALRGGGVIGAHDVLLAHELEMVTLSHEAFDRSVFANGAVTAAIWAAAQPKGLYDMKDVLGL